MLSAPHPTLGRLFAHIDPAVRFTSSKVAGSRFAARLTPFPNEASARAALALAGCDIGCVDHV